MIFNEHVEDPDVSSLMVDAHEGLHRVVAHFVEEKDVVSQEESNGGGGENGLDNIGVLPIFHS